jgi:hypothetical protein
MVGVVFLFFSANLTEKSVASFPLLACLSEAHARFYENKDKGMDLKDPCYGGC